LFEVIWIRNEKNMRNLRFGYGGHRQGEGGRKGSAQGKGKSRLYRQG